MANLGNSKESFQAHDQAMRMFGRSHPSRLEVKASRLGSIDRMWPLLLTDPVRETGGSRFPIDLAKWSSLVFVPQIAPGRFGQS